MLIKPRINPKQLLLKQSENRRLNIQMLKVSVVIIEQGKAARHTSKPRVQHFVEFFLEHRR